MHACTHICTLFTNRQTYTCIQIFGPYSWAAFLSKGLPIPEWMQLPLPFFGRSALLISSDILASPLCSLFWICRALKYLLFLMHHNELVIMFWKSNMDQNNFLTKIYFYLMWGKKTHTVSIIVGNWNLVKGQSKHRSRSALGRLKKVSSYISLHKATSPD